MKFKQILYLVIIGFVILFVFQNTVVVEIQFLFWTISASRSLLILVFVAIGILIGWLLSNHFSINRKKSKQ
jgi:uncharacterized integral membrane protein